MLVVVVKRILSSMTEACRRVVPRRGRPVEDEVILYETTRQHALRRSIDTFLPCRLQNGSCRIPGRREARHAAWPATSAPQGNGIWPGLPPASKHPSLRVGFDVAIQGHMNQCSGVSPWIATSQTLLATKRGNDEKGKCDCPGARRVGPCCARARHAQTGRRRNSPFPFRWTRIAAYGAAAARADPARGGIHARHIGCRGRNGAAALGWDGSW